MWHLPSRKLSLQPYWEHWSFLGGHHLLPALRATPGAKTGLWGEHSSPCHRLHQCGRPGGGWKFPGGLCQIPSLHRSRCCLPSWPAFRLPPVLPLLSLGCFCPGLLDGPPARVPLHHGLRLPCPQWHLLHPPELPPAAPGRHLRVGLRHGHPRVLRNLQLRVWYRLQRDPGGCPAALQRPGLQVPGQQQHLHPPELPPGEHCHDMKVAEREDPPYFLRCSGQRPFLPATLVARGFFKEYLAAWPFCPSVPTLQRSPKDLRAQPLRKDTLTRFLCWTSGHPSGSASKPKVCSSVPVGVAENPGSSGNHCASLPTRLLSRQEWLKPQKQVH